MKKQQYVHNTDSQYIVHVAAHHLDGVSISTVKGRSRLISYAQFNKDFKRISPIGGIGSTR